MRLATISALLYIIVYSGTAAADQEIQHRTMGDDAQALLLQAIQSDARSEAHKARDQYRHPFETLSFFGLEPDYQQRNRDIFELVSLLAHPCLRKCPQYPSTVP